MRIISRSLFMLITCTCALAQFPPQIKNVVLIVQENRSPDNLFHFLTPACPIPPGATGLNACTPRVTNWCYDVSPCGLSNQSGAVVPVTLTGVPLANSVDLDHSHTGFENMCDPDATFKCRNDGAWKTAANGLAYGYALNTAVTNYDGSTGHLLDPYLTFAKEYGWANFMYQTNQGPSYPAHQFLFSGTSARTDSDDTNSIFVAGNFFGDTPAGCRATASTPTAHVGNTLVQPANPLMAGCTLFDAKSVQSCGVLNTIGPDNVGSFCVTHAGMTTTVLDPHLISWKYYAPSSGSIWTAPDAIRSICDPQPNASGILECTGQEWTANVDLGKHGTDILEDIANCKLSRVSWIIPDGAWSDHPVQNSGYGPSWVAAVINAIGNHPRCPAGTPDAGQIFWENTAIIVTWDDWGGWSDNQPAKILGGLPCVFTVPATPCPGDYQYGFRVPLIVVSAYTPQGFIDNTPHDFGSILRMIEGINHLPEGMMRNADARSSTDLSEFFPLRLPRPYRTVVAMEAASFFLTYTGDVKAPDTD
jgi:phospholipase C